MASVSPDRLFHPPPAPGKRWGGNSDAVLGGCYYPSSPHRFTVFPCLLDWEALKSFPLGKPNTS